MPNAKLLIITRDIYRPVGGHRIHRMLPYFKKYFEVLVISMVPIIYGFKPYFFKTKIIYQIINLINLLFRRKIKFILREKNIIHLRGLPIPRTLNWLNIIWWRILIGKIKKLIISFNPDICLTINPFATVPFLRLIKKQRLYHVYEDIDRFDELAKGTFKKKIIGWLEKKCIKSADLVISVNRYLAQRAKSFGCKEVEIIYNGADFPKQLSQEKKVYDLIFVGLIEKYMGIDLAIKAIAKIKNQDKNVPSFLIVGDGPHLSYLKKLVTKLRVNRYVMFTGEMPYNKVKECLNLSRIGLATFVPSDLMKYAFTLKIIEYLSFGLPVITTKGTGETAEFIKNFNCGEVINYTVDECATAIRNLLINTVLYQTQSQNARNLAINFDWQSLVKKESKIILSKKYKLSKYT